MLLEIQTMFGLGVNRDQVMRSLLDNWLTC
jgi:hypothetical protein